MQDGNKVVHLQISSWWWSWR